METQEFLLYRKIKELLIKSRNSHAVNTERFWCDSYEFEAGNKAVQSTWNNEYMAQYSWGEMYIGKSRADYKKDEKSSFFCPFD